MFYIEAVHYKNGQIEYEVRGGEEGKSFLMVTRQDLDSARASRDYLNSLTEVKRERIS